MNQFKSVRFVSWQTRDYSSLLLDPFIMQHVVVVPVIGQNVDQWVTVAYDESNWQDIRERIKTVTGRDNVSFANIVLRTDDQGHWPGMNEQIVKTWHTLHAGHFCKR